MINKQINNNGLCEIKMCIVQEYLRTQGKLVTPFTLIKLNSIYDSIDYSTKCKLYKKVKGCIENE